MTETKKEKKIEKKAVSREEFDNLAAKVRTMSDNWHKFVAKYVGGDASNGSIKGSAKLGVVIFLLVLKNIFLLVIGLMGRIRALCMIGTMLPGVTHICR